MFRNPVAIFAVFLSMSFSSKVRPLVSAFVKAPYASRFNHKTLPVASSRLFSSWMDKNDDFKNFDSNEFNSSSSRQTDKQRRRRNNKRKEEFNEKQTFRENFRNTRVFVTGIPSYASWQDLKDHFKVAGDVVFASVSIDANGVSKGCGVVQFETTDMASNAIRIMRDHPMDGSVLYVREDYQENKDGKELGVKRGATPPSKWRCGDDTTLSLLSDDDQDQVRALIKARDQARRRRNYDTSDIIREDLKRKFQVHLDDRLKIWWVSNDNSVPQNVADLKGDGRWGKQQSWRQIPTTQENDMCVDPDLVNGLLAQRDIARREKDFATADRLLEQARTAPDGDLNLRIHDESRTWRIWTKDPPPSFQEAIEKPMGPAEQCIAIVEKYDPSKVNEVKTLLAKFPGREYNILKKIKQNYKV